MQRSFFRLDWIAILRKYVNRRIYLPEFLVGTLVYGLSYRPTQPDPDRSRWQFVTAGRTVSNEYSCRQSNRRNGHLLVSTLLGNKHSLVRTCILFGTFLLLQLKLQAGSYWQRGL